MILEITPLSPQLDRYSYAGRHLPAGQYPGTAS